MTHVWLVAGRELRERFRSKAYWIILAGAALVVTGVLALPALLTHDGRYELGVVGEVSPVLGDELRRGAALVDAVVEVVALPDLAAAEQAVRAGDVDGAVLLGEEVTVVRRRGTPEPLVAIVGQAAASAVVYERLVDAGVGAHHATTALAAPPLHDRLVDDTDAGQQLLATGAPILLYVAIFFGGMSVASAVLVEKSSRIADVLVATVKPAHLLAGKVLGQGTASLLLVVAAGVPLLVAAVAGPEALPSVRLVDLVASVGWFLIGFALYATAFGVLGALVDRQEDLGAVTVPLQITLVASYAVALIAANDPSSLLARAGSLFPLSAPLVTPARAAQGGADPIEVAVAVVLCLLTVLVFVRVGGAAYRRALVRGGRRLRLAEVLRG